eukprot:CAMPEP_0113633852 /NCGR_PEP_ID=MMETSP0017_2-20120614/17622_1 /TAXON_ID=2856 /ORGANISM="Cylindrotheca closterium" /LENGTH=139 /DNA_ID=CAMNT_0000544517 /DNA_START=59 /DNA_END=478 /DNA_ORIENTATION=- /assembly_acc=CAM_ASM_000147
MSTTSNMNMSLATMNANSMNLKRTDGMKNKFLLSRRAPGITAAANPMRNILSRPNKEFQDSLIDEALDIINSPESAPKPTVTGRRVSGRRGSLQKRGSVISQRRASELLNDNSDRLSELLAACTDMDDFSSDDESDLED